MSWPPPDLLFVLDTLEIVELRNEVARLTGKRPQNRAEAHRLAAKSGDLARPVYDKNVLFSGRPGVTWFRYDGRVPDFKGRRLQRISRLGDSLGDRPCAVVWARQVEQGTALRLVYTERIDYPLPSLNRVERHGFATVLWRKLQGQQVMEVHCRSQAIRKILKTLKELIGVDDLGVLHFGENEHVERIRVRLSARLCDAVAQDNLPKSEVDIVRIVAREEGDLASEGAPFGPKGQYTDLPGRGRTCEIGQRKFRISQRDYSVAFFYTVSFEDTARFFAVADDVGDWIRYGGPNTE